MTVFGGSIWAVPVPVSFLVPSCITLLIGKFSNRIHQKVPRGAVSENKFLII